MTKSSRKNGISVLLACRNEEAIIALCIVSFIDFADELVIVDNGSTDGTKEIVQELKSRYPRKIKFFDVPHLPDLYQNRQFALENSTCRWVVRADSDFVAYTEGHYNILEFREFLLGQRRTGLPKVFSVPLPNVTGDFWHTGVDRPTGGLGPNAPGRYVPPAITAPTLRIYEVFPGFRFQRQGRWEATSFHLFLRWRSLKLDRPLWMHCNLKSDMAYLYRSERTNWRELGDFKRYPSLQEYMRTVIPRKYQTDDLEEAAERYMQQDFYPFLRRYDPDEFYPYPDLIQKQMSHNPIYRILYRGGKMQREYLGHDTLA
jgi:glycosyltransferase involved in cell wall biosynthesis